MEYTNKIPSKYSKKKESSFHINNVLSITSSVVGGLSLLFLLLPGISYTTGFYPTDGSFNLGAMTFGNNTFAPLNIGLLIAFIFTILGIVFTALINVNKVAIASGMFAVVLFVTSAILYFCTVPLYGNLSASLGSGAICLGVFNLICAIITFIAASYK